MIRLSDVVKEQGLTPDRLAGAMKYLSIYAPVELDKAKERVAQTAILPLAVLLTPHGKRAKPTGAPRLAGSLKIRTRVRQAFGTTEIYSNLPYANTIHWGRKSIVREGRRYSSVVTGKRFIERAATRMDSRVQVEILREVDKLIDKQVPRG